MSVALRVAARPAWRRIYRKRVVGGSVQRQLREIAEAGSDAEGLGAMADTLLALFQRIAPADSTYLTLVEEANGVQRVVAASDDGYPIVAPHDTFDPQQSICSRALTSGETCLSDAQATWPDAGVARDLGVRSYIAVSIYMDSGELFGTLCGVSRQAGVLVGDDLQELLDLFARLIGHEMARERRVRAQRSELEQTQRLADEMAMFGIDAWSMTVRDGHNAPGVGARVAAPASEFNPI